MSIYENLVMQTQMNYSRYYGMYMAGKSPYKNSNKVIPYKEQIHIFAKQIQNAECIIVGGASGLSASGGGNFYYEDNESYRLLKLKIERDKNRLRFYSLLCYNFHDVYFAHYIE